MTLARGKVAGCYRDSGQEGIPELGEGWDPAKEPTAISETPAWLPLCPVARQFWIDC